MTFAKLERDAACDALLAVAPDSPTLCEGWSAHDLAAHLWVREHDPLALPGVVVPPLQRLTAERMERVKRRWPYQRLAEEVLQFHGLDQVGVPGQRPARSGCW